MKTSDVVLPSNSNEGKPYNAKMFIRSSIKNEYKKL